MSGRLSCKRRAVDYTTASLTADLASEEELNITDDFCETSVTFRAPKKPKYTRNPAVKSSNPSQSLPSVSSSLSSKSLAGADKENVNVQAKSSKPVAVVYTIDDDDDNVSLSPAKQASRLVRGIGRLVPKVDCKVRKSSRSTKESLSSRLTKSLPSAVSNKDIECNASNNVPTSGDSSASFSQTSCASLSQNPSTSRYFRATRSRAATSQKTDSCPTGKRSSPSVNSDSSQEVLTGVGAEINGSDDDFIIGLPSTADDPELADIEKSICSADERLCPSCKHIVASANYAVHLRQCFKQFQCQSRLKPGSSSSSETAGQSRAKLDAAGSVDTRPSTSNDIATKAATTDLTSTRHSMAASTETEPSVTTECRYEVRPLRVLSGSSNGLLQFEGQDETGHNPLLKPLQNQSCMVRVRRGGDVPKTRKGRKKKTASLTALQTASATQRSAILQRRLELIRAWRPDNSGEFEKITRGSKKRGQQRLSADVSLHTAQDRPLWSLMCQEGSQDVSRYYVAELAPHIVPPAEGSAANLTLHRALSQIPGRLNITQNINLDSDEEDYLCQDSFLSNSLSETQRVLADLLRSQASMFLDATAHDTASPRALPPTAVRTDTSSPRAWLQKSPTAVRTAEDRLPDESNDSNSSVISLKNCSVLLKRTPVKEIAFCEPKFVNDTGKSRCLASSNGVNGKESADSLCNVDVLHDSPEPESQGNYLRCGKAVELQNKGSANVLATSSNVELSKSEVSEPNFDDARRISIPSDILQSLKPVRIELTRLGDETTRQHLHEPNLAADKGSEISSRISDNESSVDVNSDTTNTRNFKDDLEAQNGKAAKHLESDQKVTLEKNVINNIPSSSNPANSDGVGSTMSFDVHMLERGASDPSQSLQDIFLVSDKCSETANGGINEVETNRVESSSEGDKGSIHSINQINSRHNIETEEKGEVIDASSKDVLDEKQNISPVKADIFDNGAGCGISKRFNSEKPGFDGNRETEKPLALTNSKARNLLSNCKNSTDNESQHRLEDGKEVWSVECEDIKSVCNSESLHSKMTEVFDGKAYDSSFSNRAKVPHTSTQVASKCGRALVTTSLELSLPNPGKFWLNSQNNNNRENVTKTHELINKPLVTPVEDTVAKNLNQIKKLPSSSEIGERKIENQCGEDELLQKTDDIEKVHEVKHCVFSRNVTMVPASDASDEDVLGSFVNNSQVPNKFKERTLSNFSVENVSKLNSFFNDSDIMTSEFRDWNIQRYFSSLPKDGFDKIPSSIPEESPEVFDQPALESVMKSKVNEDFRKLLETGAAADASIITDTGPIPVHSVVFSARSPNLYDELKSVAKPQRELRWSVSYECAKQFLCYIYSGTFELEFSDADLQAMYTLSVKYKCSDLSDYLLKCHPELSTPEQNLMETSTLLGDQETSVVSESPEIESVVSSSAMKANYHPLEKHVAISKPSERKSSNVDETVFVPSLKKHMAISKLSERKSPNVDEIMSVPSLSSEKPCSSNHESEVNHSARCNNAELAAEPASQCIVNPTPTPSPVCIDAVSCAQSDRSSLWNASARMTCDSEVKSKLNADMHGMDVTVVKELFDANVSTPSKNNRSRSPDLFEDLACDQEDMHVYQADVNPKSINSMQDQSEKTKPTVDPRSANNENLGDVVPASSELSLHSVCHSEGNRSEIIDISQSGSGGSLGGKKSQSDESNASKPARKKNPKEISLPAVSSGFKDTKPSETDTSRFTDKYNQSTDVEVTSENRSASGYLSNVWDDFEGGNGFEMCNSPLTPGKSNSKACSSSRKGSREKASAENVDPQIIQSKSRHDRVHLGLNSTAIDDRTDKQPNFPDVSIVPSFLDCTKSSARDSTILSSAKRRLCSELPPKYNDLDFYSDDGDVFSKIDLDALESNTSLSTRLQQRSKNVENYASCNSEVSPCGDDNQLKLTPKRNFVRENKVNRSPVLKTNRDVSETNTSSGVGDKPHRRKKASTFKVPENSLVSKNLPRAAEVAVTHQRVTQLRQSPASHGFTTPGTPQSAGTPITPRPDYSNMASPDLKKALDDFGVRPMPKAKARVLLKHIYEQTHPVVGTPATPAAERAPDNVYTSTPVGRSRAGSHRAKKGTEAQVDAGEVSPPACLGGEASNQPQVVDLSLSDDADEGCAEESVLLSQNNSDGDEDLHQERGSVHEQLRALITSDRSLYEAVLLYQPVWLQQVKQLATAAGIKCSMATLVDFLDQQCITFRMGAPGQGSGSRTRRKPRRRKQPIKI